jgi:hypothetical protein
MNGGGGSELTLPRRDYRGNDAARPIFSINVLTEYGF